MLGNSQQRPVHNVIRGFDAADPGRSVDGPILRLSGLSASRPNAACCASPHRVSCRTVMTVTIPDDRIGSVRLDERDALVDIAIGLYKREQVSLGRAAEIAGIGTPEFLQELGRRRISINYSVDDLQQDLATVERLG